MSVWLSNLAVVTLLVLIAGIVVCLAIEGVVAIILIIIWVAKMLWESTVQMVRGR